MKDTNCSVCEEKATTFANISINNQPRAMLPVCQCHADSVIEEGQALAIELRGAANKQRRQKEESFERCDTDGFLSQWAHDICGHRDDLAAQVAEQGFTFFFPALFDLNGNLVAAKLIAVSSKFHHGKDSMWGILENDDPHSRVVNWIKARPARVSTIEKKGYREGMVAAPAKADIMGEKTAYAGIRRTDGGFSRNVNIVDNGMLELEAK
jgi:hypothetical protein